MTHEYKSLSECPLVPALEASDGSDYTLLAAISDWCQENGLDAAAEAVRWVIHTRREVRLKGWGHDIKPDGSPLYPTVIPRRLWFKAKYHEVDSSGRLWSLSTLVLRWERSTEGEREQYWSWTPAAPLPTPERIGAQ